MSEAEKPSKREMITSLLRVAKYRPLLAVGIIAVSIFAALLEGVGVSFILPIVKIVQSPADPTQQADGVMLVFVSFYRLLGIPFTLGSVVTGVSLILIVRWTLTFLARWFRTILLVDYKREIQRKSFDKALDARVSYFDQEGSDKILNTIVTEANQASQVIRHVVTLFEQSILSLVYLSIALFLAPTLTVFAIIFLGGLSLVFRTVIDSGYELGDRVAVANELIQESAQAGTQGIRDTKLFNLKDELYDDFIDSVDQYVEANILLSRNELAITNFYNLLTAISVFILIYLAISFANMSLGALGIFLFAMFRLGPKASNINSVFYTIENTLPHLVRTQEFIDELERNQEPQTDPEPVPNEVRNIEFNDVHFSYAGQDDEALSGISFGLQKGEFVGFVGHSGAGKSTIVSLLARMYEPDSGEIRANDRPIHDMDIDQWRSRVAVVQQDPFIFNDTLRYNLTIGNRGVSQTELDRVCEITRVNEFFDSLSEGYDTRLGDEGVRLSGGQRQRVALARALLKEADVLILDEATSDLDSNLEKQVQKAVESMDQDYAMIGIAHRLSTVKNASRIYTVSGGEIVEAGTHQELLRNDGTYADLYAIQSKTK